MSLTRSHLGAFAGIPRNLWGGRPRLRGSSWTRWSGSPTTFLKARAGRRGRRPQTGGPPYFAYLLLAALSLNAQDPAYDVLTGAYSALHQKDYDKAVAGFAEAVHLSPHRADIRKDLAYTYLKIGETDLAREQFG